MITSLHPYLNQLFIRTSGSRREPLVVSYCLNYCSLLIPILYHLRIICQAFCGGLKNGKITHMSLKLYNTLSRKKEVFKPRKNKKVYLFVCGPTAYDFSHLGHARTYIVFDMLTKFLRQNGYDVFYLQNITDIDDKIIKRAKEENVSCKDLSQKFEQRLDAHPSRFLKTTSLSVTVPPH